MGRTPVNAPITYSLVLLAAWAVTATAFDRSRDSLPLNASVPQAPQPSAGRIVAALKIVVIEGEDAVNIIQQKTAVSPVVEVRDDNDLPVAGVLVRFSIAGGKNATFAGGAQTLTVTTNAAGRATATGFQSAATGQVRINVQAAFQGKTATTVISQTNVMTAAEAAAQTGSTSGGGTTTAAGAGAAGGGGLSTGAIAAIVAGAAGAAGAVAAARSGDEAPSSPPPAPSTQATPSIAGTYRGSFVLTGTSTFDGGCVADDQYTATNAEITLSSATTGVGIFPFVYQFTSRNPALCTSATRSGSVNFPITVAADNTFSSRLEFPLVIDPSGEASGGTIIVIAGQVQGDAISGTMTFDRTGGRAGLGRVTGPYTLTRVR